MCCSSLIHIIFNVVLIACCGLLIFGVIGPKAHVQLAEVAEDFGDRLEQMKWTKESGDKFGKDVVDVFSSGGFSFHNCTEHGVYNCVTDYYQALQQHEKIYTLLVMAAFMCAVIAFVWSCIVCVLKCCCAGAVTPMVVMCVLGSVFCLSAIVVQVHYSEGAIKEEIGWDPAKDEEADKMSHVLGWSVKCTGIAMLGFGANIVASTVIYCCDGGPARSMPKGATVI